MKAIKQMTVGKQYKCIKQVGTGKDISFCKGKVYTCIDVTPYLNTLRNEQGQTHPWASEKGRKMHGQSSKGWNDNWADFFIEL